MAAIPPTVLKSVFDDVSLSVLSRDFLFGVLKGGKDSALQSNCASKKFGVLKSPLMLELESSTSAIACSFLLSFNIVILPLVSFFGICSKSPVPIWASSPLFCNCNKFVSSLDRFSSNLCFSSNKDSNSEVPMSPGEGGATVFDLSVGLAFSPSLGFSLVVRFTIVVLGFVLACCLEEVEEADFSPLYELNLSERV